MAAAPPGNREELKAQERAALAQTKAFRELELQMGSTEAAALSASEAYKLLAGTSDGTKRAAAAYLETLVQVDVANGTVTDSTRGLREQQRLLNEDITNGADVASALHTKIKGLVGITNEWRRDTTASFVANKVAGKGFMQTLEEISSVQATMSSRQDNWASMSLKLTETIQLGFMAIIKQTMNLVGAFDSQTAAFKRATGASQAFVMMVPALEQKYYNLGLSMEEAAGVMGSLYSSMSGFTMMSPRHQEAVKNTAAVLETLGIDASTTAQSMEVMTRSLGMSGSQAANTTREIFSLSQQIGVSTSEMMNSFSQLAPQLAVHGNHAIAAFKRLAAAAKETGLEINKIVGLATKFDTFRGAAESVSFLNSQLGGPYLSVMKMVQATDPTDRMRALSQATRQAGLEFDKMGYYQRQALASAMGLSEVNDLALIMKGSFSLVNDQTLQTTASIEKLARENREYKTVQDELRQALRQLAVPMTKVLTALRETLMWLQKTPGAVQRVVTTVVVLKGALYGVQAAAMAATMGMGAMRAAMTGLGVGGAAAIAMFSLLHYTMSTKRHSPTLFGRGSIAQIGGQQMRALAGGISGAFQMAKLAIPQLDMMGQKLKALPKDTLRTVKTTFESGADMFDAAKGAGAINRQLAIMAQYQSGASSGRPIVIDNKIDFMFREKTLQTVMKRSLSDNNV